MWCTPKEAAERPTVGPQAALARPRTGAPEALGLSRIMLHHLDNTNVPNVPSIPK